MTILQTVIFLRGSRCCSYGIIGHKEKLITSVTRILIDINRGDKIKKMLKLPYNPSHFLDDKCSTNK